MDHKTGERIREFALIVDAIMNALPHPVPPDPVAQPDEWDGALVDVSPLYEAYNRLPASAQQVVADGYRRCLDAIEWQQGAALSALSARYQVFADIIAGTGLTPDELVPDLRQDSHLSLVRDSEPDSEPGEPAVPYWNLTT